MWQRRSAAVAERDISVTHLSQRAGIGRVCHQSSQHGSECAEDKHLRSHPPWPPTLVGEYM
eukprot:1950400-Pyramimonas_sp.AAC.1